MSFKHSLLVSVSILGLALPAAAQNAPSAAPAAPAVPPPAAALSAAAPASSGALSRQDVAAIVKDTLMNEPEIVMQAVQKLREKQAAEAKQKAKNAIAKNRDGLVNDPTSPSAGAADADVTIVEFFDYHCGYCKHVLPDVTKLIGEDKKVRVVFKEFPILSEDSVMASRAALAVNRIAKDKYFAFHTALMAHDGKFDEKSLADIAKKVGVPADKMKTEMAKDDITAILDKNRAMAEDIGIRGTPAFIIGDQLNGGAMSLEDMKKAVAEARSAKSGGAAAAPAAPAPAPIKSAVEAPAAPKPPVAEEGAAKKDEKPAAAPAAAAPAPAAPAVPPPPAAPVKP